ncbi:uncharacterized protein [Drosophila takahashii]|uniref:uncharacterized protein n=1 Tax=Drosophila takahashii TaxID=29030 RepID=UPI00389943A3
MDFDAMEAEVQAGAQAEAEAEADAQAQVEVQAGAQEQAQAGYLAREPVPPIDVTEVILSCEFIGRHRLNPGDTLRGRTEKFLSFVDHFVNVDKGTVTLLSAVGQEGNEWTKPFFLQIDELHLKKIIVSAKDVVAYRLSTYAMESFDGCHFQVLYIDAITTQKASRVRSITGALISHFQKIGIKHLMLAVVSDRNVLNELPVDYKVPKLWDLIHFRKRRSVCYSDFVMREAYSDTFLRSSLAKQFTQYFNLNLALEPPCCQADNERELKAMMKVAQRFFDLTPHSSFRFLYARNDTLEDVGCRWRDGLGEAVEALHITPRQLKHHGPQVIPRIAGVFGLFSTKRIECGVLPSQAGRT